MRPGLLSVALLAAVAAIFVHRTTAAPATITCGKELWSLKTLSDPQRRLVRLRAKATSVRAINARPMPHPTPRSRDTAYQRRAWRVRAQMVEYKLEEDGDIHIVLFDRGSYMIAEMPAAGCLARARARRTMIRVRRLFETRCGRATESWRDLGAVVYISGVGFWDFAHGQRGHARNYAELHPVTGLRFVAGCDPLPPSPSPPPPPPPTTTTQNCAPSYPDVCIPPPPPDLDCKDIPYRNFRVIYTVPDPDPHRFDGDRDGIGCET